MTINAIKTDLAQDGETTPAESAWNGFFLAAPDISDDFMSERASQKQSGRDIFDVLEKIALPGDFPDEIPRPK